MRTPAFAAALALSAGLIVPGAQASTFPPGFDDNPSVIEALAKARNTGKPVIVYFTEHNCRACGALDGWLLRRDVRQAFGSAYHFSMVFGDDMVAEERARWRATYSPRGAPSWVVLAADGSYLCTSPGGFVNATAALELHKVLSRAAARPGESTKLAELPTRPRDCNANTMGNLGL
jgi:hypothetical protein